ncbi:Phosphatidylinositol 3-/4-kinase catalytic [Neofusicoccum parvum]|nr:Phosphatidylinositol 3-/4-kinase catalytic [Neofusicoccum parvum]
MKLREVGKKARTAESSSIDLKTLVVQGQRLSEALLQACDAHVDQRAARVSLSRNLGFAHKLAPCGLVVPIEATLVASLPRNAEVIPRSYKAAFSGNVVTISSFSDDVLILNSLQRPRKVVVRGSDGRPYGLLCKPKDDLRKDQRLMEFNAMVNRALLGDVESSKRRLNIKTYAVTPLNEECGACEWVDGLKPMRDIILKLYREKNMKIDYTITKEKLNEACSHPDKISIFTDDIIKYFRPVLHEWFIETYPEPEAWFAARLKYTRSCAVMSIVGHVLGLGDRHGENLLLIEDDGRVFHVDFNCLFDKGLTFEKPELVPFRLTHNMVDAMGAYGVEGPFRLAAELTLRQLRQHIDTLMTILETFLYDPTADFVEKRRKKVRDVPNTPEEVLAGVKRKVKGFLPNETVPLSVEGYVDSLIEKARDPHNLAAMYIGWCAFF